jgi:rhomboid protease GluP
VSRTPFTGLVLGVMAVVFALETVLGGSTDPAVLLRLGANQSQLVASGQWWRLVTSIFLHIGLFHLLLNGWALYQLGSLYERWMGPRTMALTFMVSGIAGSLASVVWTRGLSAGASGAIFGVLGALISVLWQRRDRLTPQAKWLLAQLGGWAAINVVYGLSSPGIDNAAHLGGFVSGLLIGARARPWMERAV